MGAYVSGVALWFTLPFRFVRFARVPRLRSAYGDAAGEDLEVLIVGAGAAGMFAAYTLEYLGVSNYQILEASNDYGGRAQEITDFIDVPLDVGPEWIHVQPRILQDLLLFPDTVDREIIDYQPRSWLRLQRGELVNYDEAQFFYREYKFKDTTWKSYLRDYCFPYVADNIIFETEVVTVDTSGSTGVTLTTRDGRTFTGTHVIVTASVNVLQAGVIEFVPPLPADKQAEIDKINMLQGIKASLEMQEQFYPDYTSLVYEPTELDAYFDGVFGKRTTHNVVNLLHVAPDSQQSLMEQVTRSDEEILQDLVDQLDSFFDGAASEHLIQGHVENWSANPFVRGTYSISDDHNRNKILEPVNGRLYFAGEYLEKADQSTVHGAAISGRRAADRLVMNG